VMKAAVGYLEPHMEKSADGGRGTIEEWERVARRVLAVPPFLSAARAVLQAFRCRLRRDRLGHASPRTGRRLMRPSGLMQPL